MYHWAFLSPEVSSHSEAFPSFAFPSPPLAVVAVGFQTLKSSAQTALCLAPDDSSKEDGVGPANSGSSGKPTFRWRSGTAGGSALPSPDAPPPGRAHPPPDPDPDPTPAPCSRPPAALGEAVLLCPRGSGRSAAPEFTGGFSFSDRR